MRAPSKLCVLVLTTYLLLFYRAVVVTPLLWKARTKHVPLVCSTKEPCRRTRLACLAQTRQQGIANGAARLAPSQSYFHCRILIKLLHIFLDSPGHASESRKIKGFWTGMTWANFAGSNDSVFMSSQSCYAGKTVTMSSFIYWLYEWVVLAGKGGYNGATSSLIVPTRTCRTREGRHSRGRRGAC